jgi:hypothetical protein
MTWLDQQRWSDHAAVAALQAIGEVPQIDLDKIVAFYSHSGIWSAEPARSLDSPAVARRLNCSPGTGSSRMDASSIAAHSEKKWRSV